MMVSDHHRHFFDKDKTCCDLCGTPLLYGQFVAQKGKRMMLCHSLICKQVIIDGKMMTSHQFDYHIAQRKRKLKAQRQEDLKKKIYTKKIMEKEAGENRAILATVTRTRPSYTETNLYALSIPSGHTTVAEVDRKKYDGYVSNLSGMINKVFEVDRDADEAGDDAELSSISSKEGPEGIGSLSRYKAINAQICGVCKGGCCTNGGNHAYISTSTILRVRQQHPEWTPEDMLNAYLSKIGDTSVKNGCINQSDKGCVLPRDLRSNTCNNFFCNGVRKFNERMEDRDEITPTLVIQRSNTNWNAFDPSFDNKVLNVVLIDGDETEEIDHSETGLQTPDSDSA